jgi:flagellar biogenesis protein FliO
MNQAEFNQERMVAEENSNKIAESGINWAVISLGLIAAIILIGGLLFLFSPKPTPSLNQTNQNTSSGAPIQGR